MNTASIETKLNAVEGGLRTLSQIVASGLLRCGLPRHAGGDGGSLDRLSQAAMHLARTDPAAARVLWAQRLAVEALAQSSNVGVREYILPDLLSGDRAGALPYALDRVTLKGRFAAKGWRLDGEMGCTPNLQWINCTVIAPIQLEDHDAGWVLLRAEEDGLRFHRLASDEAPPFSRSAHVHASHVFFREDEWLGGADLYERIAPVVEALKPALEA